MTGKMNETTTEMEDKGAKVEEATDIGSHILQQPPIKEVPLKTTVNNWATIILL